jgi:hypothetical protein
MYLIEYLGLRGVGAAALTVPEATLLGIDNTVSGWVGRNAHVEIPAELAALAAKKPGKDALKSMASALLAKAGRAVQAPLGADEPLKLDGFHRHEAIDRCDLFARMVEENLLSHPAVQANAAARELIEAAITSLAEAYQVLCQDQGD